jgi:hypothetical protein
MTAQTTRWVMKFCVLTFSSSILDDVCCIAPRSATERRRQDGCTSLLPERSPRSAVDSKAGVQALALLLLTKD